MSIPTNIDVGGTPEYVISKDKITALLNKGKTLSDMIVILDPIDCSSASRTILIGNKKLKFRGVTKFYTQSAESVSPPTISSCIEALKNIESSVVGYFVNKGYKKDFVLEELNNFEKTLTQLSQKSKNLRVFMNRIFNYLNPGVKTILLDDLLIPNVEIIINLAKKYKFSVRGECPKCKRFARFLINEKNCCNMSFESVIFSGKYVPQDGFFGLIISMCNIIPCFDDVLLKDKFCKVTRLLGVQNPLEECYDETFSMFENYLNRKNKENDKYGQKIINCMKYKAPKGTRDFLPSEQIVRQSLIDVCRRVFERYGFLPVDTPAMERIETLTSKGTGGSEIGKEIFTLKDRGGRQLGLRFDLTVGTARVLSNNKQIRLPFKRYQMGKVWRQEFGTRMREFWQCDFDIIGAASSLSDLEIIQVFQDIYTEFGLKDFEIIYNSRKLLNKICDAQKVPESKRMKVIIAFDKLNKIGVSGVEKEFVKLGISKSLLNALLKAKVSDDPELKRLNLLAKKLKLKARFDPSLARGLDYYTGVVFEVKSKSYPSSIGAGGRYDKLLATMGGSDLPAVGGSIGIDRVYDILKSKGMKSISPTMVYIVPIETETDSLKIANQLRSEGINVEMDLVGRSVSKNLDYAAKRAIPYVLIIGKKELGYGKFSLRDMKTGKEQRLNIKQVIGLLI